MKILSSSVPSSIRPLIVNYQGLRMHHSGEVGRPTIILAKGLGIPGKEKSWLRAFDYFGYNTVYAPYRGTWGSEGTFLSGEHYDSLCNQVSDDLSVTQDVRDMIDFAVQQYDPPEIGIIAECFGASPALVASATSTHTDKITKIFMFGGLIYHGPRQEQYQKPFTVIGQNKLFSDAAIAAGRRLQAAKTTSDALYVYNGFNIAVWNAMIQGDTKLRPYDYLSALAKKNVFAMHPLADESVNPERTTDFMDALTSYSEPHKQRCSILWQGTHRTAFGPEEEIDMIEFFLGKSLCDHPELFLLYTNYNNERISLSRWVQSHGRFKFASYFNATVQQVITFQEEGFLTKNKPLEELLHVIF